MKNKKLIKSSDSYEDNKDIVAAIIVKNSQLLAEMRSEEERIDPGKITFPGGHVKNEEDLNSALKREIKEELGIDVIIYNYLTSINYSTDIGEKTFHFYVIMKYLGEIFPQEGQKLIWFNKNDISVLDTCRDKAALNLFLNIENKKSC